MTHTIHILNASHLSGEDLQLITEEVGRIFSLPSATASLTLDFKQAFDESRGQHNADSLLLQLLRHPGSQDEKRIVVVDVDIFIPVLTFIFGEAQFEGQTAIVSTHRLSNDFYGLPHDHGVMLARLTKELVHELGHTFGLYHCRQFECVMRSSTYVEEIDLKSSMLCAACSHALNEVFHNTESKKDG